ncbi:MAG: SMC-Scp complex subunit ScpB [Actinomycetota bacterium]
MTEVPPSGDELLDDGDELRRAIEAIVLVSDEPVPSELLAQLLEVSVPRIDEICGQLALDYEASGRGFQLARVAGGYRYQSHPDQEQWIERYVLEGRSAKLSAAGLETLAIVAYKQPISRAQVSAIRGVNVDGVMRTLQNRGYLIEVGRDPGPGQAVLYGTSQRFLEELGVDSLDDLPPLASFMPDSETVDTLERGLRTSIDADLDAEAGDGPTS